MRGKLHDQGGQEAQDRAEIERRVEVDQEDHLALPSPHGRVRLALVFDGLWDLIASATPADIQFPTQAPMGHRRLAGSISP